MNHMMASIYNRSDGDVRVNIQSLSRTIQRRLRTSPRYSENRCIYRVPNLLRQTNEKVFTPVIVSIGPLHRNVKRLFPMQPHKLNYLHSFLTDPDASVDLLSSCLRLLKKKEAKIRECYADPISLSSDEFCEMVLTDSAFIIQLFRKEMTITVPEDDYMYGNPRLVVTVRRDICLEENQLPFFIVDKLYRTAFQTNSPALSSVPSFAEIACGFLGVERKCNVNVRDTDYLHLLHMLVLHRIPADTHNDNYIDRPIAKAKIQDLNNFVLPAATQLHEAGVKFKVIKDSSNVFGIQFDGVKGILKMPTLYVTDETEYEFRNMVAFEQCNYRFNKIRYYSDYQYFLDCLINSREDVQLLIDAGIIQNWMGSPQEVADFINSLSSHVSTSSNDGYYYGETSLEVIHYCKKKWPRYRATLMHTYLKHPWAAISVVYAIALLLFTIAQVVAGILSIP